jgi:hypothetical protein
MKRLWLLAFLAFSSCAPYYVSRCWTYCHLNEQCCEEKKW